MEDDEILARIGKLAGQINTHKTRKTADGSREGSRSNSPYSSWHSQRGAPYPRSRDHRGGSMLPKHRHRSIRFDAGTSKASERPMELSHITQNQAEDNIADADQQGRSGWVRKRDRHVQLINSSVFEEDSQKRAKAMKKTMTEKAKAKDQQQRVKVANYMSSLLAKQSNLQPIPSNTTQSLPEMSVHGVRFQVVNGGSKLTRIRGKEGPFLRPAGVISLASGTTEVGQATPKSTKIGGVTFVRSRNGNLYRSGLVKSLLQSRQTKKIDEPCKRFSTTGIVSCPTLSLPAPARSRQISMAPSADFSIGRCAKGPTCPYTHNPDTVSACTDFLKSGNCPAGGACDLSHNLTPERTPACLHFLKGKCTNDPCRYIHVHVNPSAPVCKDFATLGYCRKGITCEHRHVHECPEYANVGICRKKKCHLPHVDRAGQLRKQAAQLNNVSSEDEDNDIFSDEAMSEAGDSDDVDSDGLEEEPILLTGDLEPSQISTNEDFVGF